MEPPIAAEVEPEIWMETEPEEQTDVEVQAQSVQVSPREELAANLNPVPDMPTTERFLAEWMSIATGGTSTPEFITAVTPFTVTAGSMQQLIETPGVEIMTILVTIPLTTTETTMVVSTTPVEHATVEVTATSGLVTSAAQSITSTAASTQEVAEESSEVTATALAILQGQLWREGWEESERIVELELDQGEESQNGSQIEEDIQEKGDQKEMTSENSENEEQRKMDMRSTLTSEPESDKEPDSQPPPSDKLKPILSLFDAPLPTGDVTSSTDFNLDDPLGMKAMRAALQNLTGSKGPKGPRKCKATMPLKRLAPAIKLAKENAKLKLRGSTPSGFYQRPKPAEGKDGKPKKWRPGVRALQEIHFYQKKL